MPLRSLARLATQMKHCCIYLPLFLLSSSLGAIDLGTWNILNVRYKINDRLSIISEAQIRSFQFYHQFHYYEYKASFQYQIHPNFSTSLGIGDYDTYSEGATFQNPKNNDELRIWPMIRYTQTYGLFEFENRFRTEFRFTSNGYRNRFRYRIGLAYSLRKVSNALKNVKLNLSNELFLTNKDPYFERNRILALVNIKTSKNTDIQIGYVHQFDYKINDEIGRDFLQIGLYLILQPKKQERSD